MHECSIRHAVGYKAQISMPVGRLTFNAFTSIMPHSRCRSFDSQFGIKFSPFTFTDSAFILSKKFVFKYETMRWSASLKDIQKIKILYTTPTDVRHTQNISFLSGLRHDSLILEVASIYVDISIEVARNEELVTIRYDSSPAII